MDALFDSMASFMDGGDEVAYVYNHGALVRNCRETRSLYPESTVHYYDIRALPNLSVLHVIYFTLRSQMVVPDDAWRNYVFLAGVADEDTRTFSRTDISCGSLDELNRALDAADDGAPNGPILVDQRLAPELISDGSVLARVEVKRPFLIFDASEISPEASDKYAAVISEWCSRSRVGCGVIHGADLLGDVCSLWLRVRVVKEVRGKKYVVLSGGANVLWDATEGGNALRHKYAPCAAGVEMDDEQETATFCGPLCTPQDALAIDFRTTELIPGDIVTIRNVGASLYHKSPIYFIGHPKPVELMQVNDNLYPLHTSR
jgi:hypothetical protein